MFRIVTLDVTDARRGTDRPLTGSKKKVPPPCECELADPTPALTYTTRAALLRFAHIYRKKKIGK